MTVRAPLVLINNVIQPLPVADTVSTGSSSASLGRLTLTTAVPVTSSDVTGATTLYYTPYIGDTIALYDGTQWVQTIFTEASLAVGTKTSATQYDVFGFLSGGALALEFSAAWTNNTTRSTALTTLNGVKVKSGDSTRRFLGTVRTTSTTTLEDSQAKRFVWNYRNRVGRALFQHETTNHTYGTAAWRAWNNSSATDVQWVLGLVEEPVLLQCLSEFKSGNTDGACYVGVGINTSTFPQYAVLRNTTTQIFRIGAGIVVDTTTLGLGQSDAIVTEFGNGTTPADNFIEVYLTGTVNG